MFFFILSELSSSKINFYDCIVFFTLCFLSNRSATAGTQEEPAVGVGVIPAARSSPVADPFETGPPISSKRYAMASTAQVMGPACVATQQEPFGFPERVLNTMAEARARLLDASML